MNTQTLTLTPAELYWLASAWGCTRLWLVDDLFRSLTYAQTQSLLLEARESLIARGLAVQTENLTWQLDPLAASLAYLASTAESITTLNITSRTGEIVRINIYPAGDTFVSLQMGTKSLIFELYRQPQLFLDQVSVLLGSENPVASTELYTLSSQEAGNLIQLAWRSESFLPNIDPATSEWLISLQKFSTLTKYNLEENGMVAKKQFFIASNGTQCWEMHKDALFIPISQAQLADIFGNTLTGDTQ